MLNLYVSRLLCAALMLVLLSVIPVAAQGTTADVEGTVQDESRAVLPGVAVTIVNVETGLRRTMVTGETGRYRLQGLPPGRYDVTASTSSQFVFDVRVAKDLRLGGSRMLQLMFETFNLTNRANFTAYNNNTLTPLTLGKPTQAADPRQMQLGIRVTF